MIDESYEGGRLADGVDWLVMNFGTRATTRTITLIILVAFVMSERRVGFSRA